MGPGKESSDSDPRTTKYQATKLKRSPTFKNLKKWRVNVATWCRIVANAYGKEKSDPKLKQKNDLLPLHLHSAHNPKHQSIFEELNRNKTSNLQNSSDTLKDVLSILNVIVRKMSESYVTSIITSFQEIIKTTSKDKDLLKNFVLVLSLWTNII